MNKKEIKKQIDDWLKQNRIHNYNIDDNLIIHVDDNVSLSAKRLRFLPYRFGTVTGSFYIGHNPIESLINTPGYIGKDFDMSYTQIKYIDTSPIIIKGAIQIHCSLLQDMKGFKDFEFEYIGIDEKQRNNFQDAMDILPISSVKRTNYKILSQDLKRYYFQQQLTQELSRRPSNCPSIKI